MTIQKPYHPKVSKPCLLGERHGVKSQSAYKELEEDKLPRIWGRIIVSPYVEILNLRNHAQKQPHVN